jgi:hypothetical protein
MATTSTTGRIPCQICGQYNCMANHWQQTVYPNWTYAPTTTTPVVQMGSLGGPFYSSSFDETKARMEQDVERRICRRITDILDGHDFPVPQSGSEPWESTRKKLIMLAKIAKAFELREKKENANDKEDNG